MSIPRTPMQETLRALLHKRHTRNPRMREIIRAAIPQAIERLRAGGY